jgi:hypothetical protein
MKRSLRVLLTNHQLGEPGGSEVNVRDWAIALQRRSHRPIVYAPVLGKTADFLRSRSIPVVDDLSLVTEPPDIIHGSHTPAVLEAIVRFPHVPAIQICQAIGHPMSEPLLLRQVRRHVATDEANRDYLVTEGGVPPERVEILHNAVDIGRIPARQPPLPLRPERALVFTKTQAQVPIILEACRLAKIPVDTLGRGVDRVILDPEQELVKYDLIFATARSAIEAIASGAATIVVDGRGLAGMATRANLDQLRRDNFGIRSLVHKVTVEGVLAEIDRYNPSDAIQVTEQLRANATVDKQLDALENIYASVLWEFDTSATMFSERELLEQLVPILHKWLPRFPGTTWAWQYEKADLLKRIEQLDALLSEERASLFLRLRNGLRQYPRLNRALIAIANGILRERKC